MEFVTGSAQLDNVLDRLQDVHEKQNGKGWESLCPAHDDHHRSLGIAKGDNNKVLLNCGAGCGYIDIVKAIGLRAEDLFPTEAKTERRVVDCYNYNDESWQTLFQVVRYDPKEFRQRCWTANEQWSYSLNGVRRILYRLPELLSADPSDYVFIVEGEKDANILAELGFVVTTSPGGAGKWQAAFNEPLHGRKVVILPDNDGPGLKHADSVARSLHGTAATVQIVQLSGLPLKGDVSNWLDAGGTVEGLSQLVLEGALFDPSEIKPEIKQDLAPSTFAITFSGQELLCMEIPEPKWAVQGILPEGVTLLIGRPKLGKSWMALNLAIAVSFGGAAFGSIPVEQGSVLYLALEDTKRRLQDRLRKLVASVADTSALAHLNFAVTWPSAHEGGLEHLDQWLSSHPGTRLVFIDTLKRFRPRREAGKANYDSDYQDIADIKTVADKYSVAVVIVHHDRKMDAEDPIDAASGTLGLTGAADGVLVLKRKRGQSNASLAVIGRDVDERKLNLRWDTICFQWEIVDESKEFQVVDEVHKDTKVEQCAAFIKETLGSESLLSDDLEKKCEDAGFPKRTYQFARKLANVKASRQLGRWYVSLRNDSPEQPNCQTESTAQGDLADTHPMDICQNDTLALLP